MKIKLKQTHGFFLKTHLPYLSPKKKKKGRTPTFKSHTTPNFCPTILNFPIIIKQLLSSYDVIKLLPMSNSLTYITLLSFLYLFIF